MHQKEKPSSQKSWFWVFCFSPGLFSFLPALCGIFDPGFWASAPRSSQERVTEALLWPQSDRGEPQRFAHFFCLSFSRGFLGFPRVEKWFSRYFSRIFSWFSRVL